MSIEGGTKKTRAKAGLIQPLGLSADEAAARIAEAFGPQDPTPLPIQAPQGDKASPAEAAPASEPAKAPAREPEPPQAAESRSEPPTKFRPGLYRVLDEDGNAEAVPEEDVARFERLDADYTRKTQALADERRQFYAEQAALKAEREQIATDKARAAALLKSAVPAEPDWDAVYQRDPANAATYWMAHQVQVQKAQKAEQEAREASAKVAQDRQASERARLLELIPAWKDPNVAQKEQAELSHYIAAQGWDQQQVAALVNDSRAIRIARTAMLAERQQAAEPERKAAAQIKIDRVKVATPGGAQAPAKQPTEFDRARNQFLKTGKLKDSIALFDQLLK
jgi:hypothetical protein